MHENIDLQETHSNTMQTKLEVSNLIRSGESSLNSAQEQSLSQETNLNHVNPNQVSLNQINSNQINLNHVNHVNLNQVNLNQVNQEHLNNLSQGNLNNVSRELNLHQKVVNLKQESNDNDVNVNLGTSQEISLNRDSNNSQEINLNHGLNLNKNPKLNQETSLDKELNLSLDVNVKRVNLRQVNLKNANLKEVNVKQVSFKQNLNNDNLNLANLTNEISLTQGKTFQNPDVKVNAVPKNSILKSTLTSKNTLITKNSSKNVQIKEIPQEKLNTETPIGKIKKKRTNTTEKSNKKLRSADAKKLDKSKRKIEHDIRKAPELEVQLEGKADGRIANKVDQNSNTHNRNVQNRNTQNRNTQSRNVGNGNMRNGNMQNGNIQNGNTQNENTNNGNTQNSSMQNNNAQNSNGQTSYEDSVQEENSPKNTKFSIKIKMCSDCGTNHIQNLCPLQNPHYIIQDAVTEENWVQQYEILMNGKTEVKNESLMDKEETKRKYSFAYMSLPNVLYFEDSNTNHGLSVFTKTELKEFTQLGPVIGRNVKEVDISEDSTMRDLWEISQEDSNTYVNTENLNEANWTRFIRPAPNRENRNVSAISKNNQLFFVSVSNIDAGEELLYWQDDTVNTNKKKMEKTSEYFRGFYFFIYYRLMIECIFLKLSFFFISYAYFVFF